MKPKFSNGFADASTVTTNLIAELPENVAYTAGVLVGTGLGVCKGTVKLAARCVPLCCKKAFAAGLKRQPAACEQSPVDAATPTGNAAPAMA